MQLRFRGPSALRDPASGQLDAMPETAMSAARQAAEAAFQVARPSATDDTPTVTVRRSRGSAPGRAGAEAEPLVEAAGLANGPGKRPRVFLLEPVEGLTLDSATVAGDPTPATQSVPLRRARRTSSVQRPGPVVQVFKAVADKVASTGAPLATHTDVPTFAQLRALARMLAGVQSILEEAQRASAFRVLGR